MLRITRVLLLGLLSVGIAAATTAQAGTQLFEGSWTVKAFGNECRDATDPTPGPDCGGGSSRLTRDPSTSAGISAHPVSITTF